MPDRREDEEVIFLLFLSCRPFIARYTRWSLIDSRYHGDGDRALMQELLSDALAQHLAGQMGAAALLYKQVLSADQANVDALHLLGVLRHQQGEHRQAVELISQAVALRPNVAAFHANLAEAYRAQGQLERAIGCCRTALRLTPDYPEALNNLGLTLQELGRAGEAIEQFQHALQLQPNSATTHNILGICLRELKQMDEALSHFRTAVEIDPAFGQAQTNLGQVLVDRGKAEEALPH